MVPVLAAGELSTVPAGAATEPCFACFSSALATFLLAFSLLRALAVCTSERLSGAGPKLGSRLNSDSLLFWACERRNMLRKRAAKRAMNFWANIVQIERLSFLKRKSKGADYLT